MGFAHIVIDGCDIISSGFVFKEVRKIHPYYYLLEIMIDGGAILKLGYANTDDANKDRTQLITNVLNQMESRYAKTSSCNTEAFGVVTESESRSDESLECPE